ERLTLPLERTGGLNAGAAAAERFAVQFTAASNNFSPSAFNAVNVSPPSKLRVRRAGAVTGLPLIGSGFKTAFFSKPNRTARVLKSGSAASATIMALGARRFVSTDASCVAGAG